MYDGAPPAEIYPCFVKVADDEQDEDNVMELPTEKDGTIILSTVQAQFPSALGLKYKNPTTGGWRGIRLSDNVLDPPFEGWGSAVYYITLPKTDSVKRKMDESPNREPEAKLVKTGSESDFLSDLIVLGLPYKAAEHDVKEYFQQFGELSMQEIKFDPVTKESRGFGFIRYKNAASAQKALKASHNILGRRCELRLPKKKDEGVLKLFIGRLPEGTTKEEMEDYFTKYGELTDVYIPNPFRGFGFVTFQSSDIAKQVLHMHHDFKGARINVTYAEPKNEARGGPRGGSRYSSHQQDAPFDFEDMRQLMYNNPRGSPNPYNQYKPSSKSSRSGNDMRGMSYPTGGNMNMAYSAADIQTMQQYMQNSADPRGMQYGFWSNNK